MSAEPHSPEPYNAGELPHAERHDAARLVTALFDTRASAETARADLVAAGIPEHTIVVEAGATDATPGAGEGFWETLKSLFIPDDDRHSYAEGQRRGGVTVAVRTDTATHDRVVELLDRDGAIDLDEEEQSWRAEGWGRPAAAAPSVDGVFVDARSQEPGLVSQPSLTRASVNPEEEPRYARPSDATAGFGANAADQFPFSDAPPVESPGALPESERVATPDGAYAGAAPGLSPNPGAPAVPATADGAGAVVGTAAAPDRPARVGIRDVTLGRARVRSYRTPDDLTTDPRV